VVVVVFVCFEVVVMAVEAMMCGPDLVSKRLADGCFFRGGW